MQRSRRTFLKCIALGAGTGVGGISWWLGVSKERAACYARRLLEDARRRIAPAPAKPNPKTWSDNEITLAWLGHSTVLINFYGLNILTDPALGSRVGVSLGPLGTAGSKRYIAPALRVRELPPIDVLLLSHAHMDHMDLPTVRYFPPATFTATARETSDLLAAACRKNVQELRWGESATFRSAKGDLRIEAFEVKHWGQRWPSEVPRGYNGYVLRREGKAILFGGDTALTPLFKEIGTRGPFETALMPIAAYQPWIWNHCTPEQALEMANVARARYILPIHHQTFRLSDEPMHEPIQRLEIALAHEPERLALRHPGESFVVPKA
jgi:L-ascorbate metabolism protein UlaG (beta-lactamase superfamily)